METKIVETEMTRGMEAEMEEEMITTIKMETIIRMTGMTEAEPKQEFFFHFFCPRLCQLYYRNPNSLIKNIC